MSENSLKAAGSSKPPIDYRNRQGWFLNSVLKSYWLSPILKTSQSTVSSTASKQKTGYLVS